MTLVLKPRCSNKLPHVDRPHCFIQKMCEFLFLVSVVCCHFTTCYKLGLERLIWAPFLDKYAESNVSLKMNISDMTTKRWRTNGCKRASGSSSPRLPNVPRSWYYHPTSCNSIMLMQRRGNGFACRRRALHSRAYQARSTYLFLQL